MHFLTNGCFPLIFGRLVCSAVARESRRAAEGVANVSEDNRLAPPGSMLLNLGTRTTPNRAGEPAGDTVKTSPGSAKPAASEPSWGRVLATTIKLWVLRARRWLSLIHI